MKPLIGSHTFLNNYENCPRKAYHVNVAKDLPKEPMSPEMKRGIDVHEAFERRLRDGKPLPAEFMQYEPFAAFFVAKHPAVELMLGMREDGSACDFFDPNVWLRGKLDATYAELGPPKISWLGDWKTGKKREDPRELEIFGLLLRAKHLDIAKVYGRYIWLKTMEIGQLHDVSDAQRIYLSVKKQMDDVQHSAKTNYWPPKQNPLCGWCPVKKCEFNKRI
jgi:hypothetical protein